MRYAVRISHLSRDELAVFGYYYLGEDEEFTVYVNGGGYDGQTIVVEKANPLLFVDDINDAAHMRAPVELAVKPKTT